MLVTNPKETPHETYRNKARFGSRPQFNVRARTRRWWRFSRIIWRLHRSFQFHFQLRDRQQHGNDRPIEHQSQFAGPSGRAEPQRCPVTDKQFGQKFQRPEFANKPEPLRESLQFAGLCTLVAREPRAYGGLVSLMRVWQRSL